MMKLFRNSSGMVLPMVVFVVAILLALSGAGLLSSGLGLKTTSHQRAGDMSFQVADAGIQHAVVTIPPGVGFSYASLTQIVPTAAYPSLTGYNYSVSAVNTGGGTKAILTATATGPGGAQKVVVAYVERGNYGFGAIHIPGAATSIETSFSGDSFTINGNDACSAAPAVPGITTTDWALVTELTDDTLTNGGLDSSQKDNVTGYGTAPSVSVLTASLPTVGQLANDFLALSHTELGCKGQSCIFAGNGTWGTSSTPAITRIDGNATITGTIEGYGVLIVDGALDVDLGGNFSFHGLVIARGDIAVEITGNANIYGSLMLGDSINYDPQVELDIRGNANVRFDSCALAAANAWRQLPKTARLIAWQEIM